MATNGYWLQMCGGNYISTCTLYIIALNLCIIGLGWHLSAVDGTFKSKKQLNLCICAGKHFNPRRMKPQPAGHDVSDGFYDVIMNNDDGDGDKAISAEN